MRMMRKTISRYFDTPLILLLSAVYLVIDLVNYAKNIYFKWYGLGFKNLSYYSMLKNMLYDWLAVTFFAMFLVVLVKYMVSKKISAIWSFIIHLFLSFFIGFFALWISFGREGMWNVLSPENIKPYFNYVIRLADLHFLVYLSFITIIYMYYYFRRLREKDVQNHLLKEQLTKSHLQFLQSQLHPHFLFNTLNGIHSLMDISIEKSQSMVVDLSDLLRNVLDKKDQNLIELQEELNILNKYLNIKKYRFSDQLNFHIEIQDHLENALVPNMILQPIIENSTKHGYDEEHRKLDVFIKIFKKNDRLVIKIENNGKLLNAPCDELCKKGTGLRNIKERLNTLYRNDYVLKMYNKNKRVITKIELPFEVSVAELCTDY